MLVCGAETEVRVGCCVVETFHCSGVGWMLEPCFGGLLGKAMFVYSLSV